MDPSDDRFRALSASVADHVRVTLEAYGGNRNKAAAAMGISERTLYRKIREYGW